jgi:hypothetical protein
MSRSYHTKKKIPRDFFPRVAGETMVCKDGTVITAEIAEEEFICFSAPYQTELEDFTGLADELLKTLPNGEIVIPIIKIDGEKAYVSIYFDKGFVMFYDMKFPSLWSGWGPWLLGKLRSLTKGKFSK